MYVSVNKMINLKLNYMYNIY